jgi:4-amino-4-deoxy-L-arabinose transferase-like glycosyltransferase
MNALRGIFIAGFLARLGMSLARHDPWLPGGDSGAFVNMGLWIFQGIGDAHTNHAPVYSFFLYLFYTLPQQSLVIAFMAQSLVGACASLLVYRLCHAWTSEKAALLAAALVAFDPFLIYFSSLFLSETLFTTLLLAGLVYLFKVKELPTLKNAFASGVLLSLGALCRSVLSPFLPLFVVAIVYLTPDTLRKTGRLIVSFVIGVFIPMALWSLVVHHKTGHWLLVSAQKGWVIYEGLNPDFDSEDGVKRWIAGMRTQVAENNLVDPVKQDAYFMEKSISHVRQYPVQTMKLMTRKIFKFWRLYPYFSYSNKVRIISAIFMSFLIFFSLYGLWVGGLRTTSGQLAPESVTLVAFVILYTLANTITWTQIRYRVPLHPIVSIFCARGVLLWAKNRKLLPS